MWKTPCLTIAAFATFLAGCPFAMQNDYFIATSDNVAPANDGAVAPPPPATEPDAASTDDAPMPGTGDGAPPGAKSDGGCCSGHDCDRMMPGHMPCEDASCKGKDCQSGMSGSP